MGTHPQAAAIIVWLLSAASGKTTEVLRKVS